MYKNENLRHEILHLKLSLLNVNIIHNPNILLKGTMMIFLKRNAMIQIEMYNEKNSYYTG